MTSNEDIVWLSLIASGKQVGHIVEGILLRIYQLSGLFLFVKFIGWAFEITNIMTLSWWWLGLCFLVPVVIGTVVYFLITWNYRK